MSKAAEPAQGRSRLVLKCKITPTGGLAVLCAACCASKYAKQHLFISLLASSQISEGAFGGGESYATPPEAVQYQASSSARSEAVGGEPA